MHDDDAGKRFEERGSSRTLAIWIGSFSLAYLAFDAHRRARGDSAVSPTTNSASDGVTRQPSSSVERHTPVAAATAEPSPRAGFVHHVLRALFFVKATEKFGVMGFGTGLLLWMAMLLTAVAIGFRGSLPATYLLETVSGVLGLAGAVKIGDGVVLGGAEIRELWRPLQTATQASEESNRQAIVGILDAMKAASDACAKGTVFLVVALLIQLIKPGAETEGHKRIELPPAPAPSVPAKAPPARPQAAAPIGDIPSRPEAVASRPAAAASRTASAKPNQPARSSAPQSAASRT